MEIKISGRIGSLEDPVVIFRKKNRWTFEAYDKAGKSTFPTSFVKLDCHHLDQQARHSVSFKQFFCLMDRKGEAKACLNEILDKVDDTLSASLKQWDGCGTLLEEWHLKYVCIELDPSTDTSNDDDIIAEWNVTAGVVERSSRRL